MHANMVQHLSIKEQLLSTLKRDKHGHMANILSTENHVKDGAKPTKQDKQGMQLCPKLKASQRSIELHLAKQNMT